MNTYSFNAKVWLTEGFGGWYFANVPKDISQEIKDRFSSVVRRGFGSLRVTATVGKTSWNTSIFPSKEGYYLLAIKAEVRKQENIQEDDEIMLTLELREL